MNCSNKIRHENYKNCALMNFVIYSHLVLFVVLFLKNFYKDYMR